MDYLQLIVHQALLKSPHVAEVAESYAKKITSFADLLNLDAHNLSLVAEELGATPEQFVGFLEVVKAVHNSGTVENHIYIKGFVREHIKEEFRQAGMNDLLKEYE